MQYRRFGRLDWKASALGFGCMRLPILGGDHSAIDETLATRMLHYAIDCGVSYIDTAYPYHEGNSELVVGRALKGRYRNRVQLATKLPCRLVEAPEDFDRFLNEQLRKLQVDHIDCYLLHSLRESNWHRVRDFGVLEWAEKAQADGRIGHVGFSFHDSYEVFQEIVDAYDGWAFCQIKYNYMDVNEQAGTRGLRYAATKGLGVVIMEPLLGGRLVSPPSEVQALWDAAPQRRTPADWALQWLWSQPEVSVVLSGMSTMEQVEQNIASAAASKPNALTPEELVLIERVRSRYQELCPIPCTGCRYCLPCPNGLRIPRLFDLYNSGRMYNALDDVRRTYGRVPEPEKASACQACRECEDKCPQQLPVSEWMVRVHQVLGEGAPYLGSGPHLPSLGD